MGALLAIRNHKSGNPTQHSQRPADIARAFSGNRFAAAFSAEDDRNEISRPLNLPLPPAGRVE